MSESQKNVRLILVKSLIGRPKKHIACVKGLGLRKIRQQVVVADTSENRGMINQIRYLVSVEEL